MKAGRGKRKAVKKSVVVVGADTSESAAEGRKVFRGARERARVSPTLSQPATERIRRLEAASSLAGRRLGDIRLN